MSKTVAFKCPDSFFETYERRDGDPLTTHYCPGCGHGMIHKYIAEAIDDFELQDRAILVNPVGCSVFAYYYFNIGNVQVPHGRCPAVATGMKRCNPDKVVFSYQGDGDLAAIGAGEIVNAANRGECISVFFVNNATYGMTGGQMAPTTLAGQKTTTCPRGRLAARDGHPMKVIEMLAQLSGTAYAERCALDTPVHIRAARNAIRHAFDVQIAGRGFAIVEILSACPVGWGVSPVAAVNMIRSHMLPEYPLGVAKDIAAPATTTHRASVM